MQILELKNGFNVSEMFVNVTFGKITALYEGKIKGTEGEKGKEIVHALYKRAADEHFSLSSEFETLLKDQALLERDGSVEEDTKNILFSAIKEGNNVILLSNPVKGK